MDLSQITAFFGWCAVINVSILAFSAFVILVFKDFTMGLHSKYSSIDVSTLPTLYFQYIANYKIGIIIFTIAPYIALKLIA